MDLQEGGLFIETGIHNKPRNKLGVLNWNVGILVINRGNKFC